MTPSAVVSGGRQVTWTRDKLIASIRRWVELYGEPPRAADWNPSSAKWSGQTWRIARYHAGDPDTGEPWPSLNATKKAFLDPDTGKPSLNAAVRAAGFEPNRPGPPNRKAAAPVLDEAKVEMHPQIRVALEAARAEARDLAAKVEVRERQLEAARGATARARDERDMARRARERRTVTKTKTKTKTKTRTVVREDKAAARKLEKAEARIAALEGELKEAKFQAVAAKRDATRMASKLERAEATVTDVRAERREAREEARALADKLTVARRGLDAARAEAAVTPEPEIIVKVERQVVELPAPEAAIVEEAHRIRAEAERRIEAAELRTATAEREYRELAEVATGESRKLTPAEMAELRAGGPSGPAVLADAIGQLARARKAGGKLPLRAALGAVASAAIRYRDRL